MKTIDREAARQIIRRVLKADFACDDRGFEEAGVFVYPAREVEGRRRFPVREKTLSIMTTGKGVVVSCSPDRIEWVKKNLSAVDGALGEPWSAF